MFVCVCVYVCATKSNLTRKYLSWRYVKLSETLKAMYCIMHYDMMYVSDALHSSRG